MVCSILDIAVYSVWAVYVPDYRYIPTCHHIQTAWRNCNKTSSAKPWCAIPDILFAVLIFKFDKWCLYCFAGEYCNGDSLEPTGQICHAAGGRHTAERRRYEMRFKWNVSCDFLLKRDLNLCTQTILFSYKCWFPRTRRFHMTTWGVPVHWRSTLCVSHIS